MTVLFSTVNGREDKNDDILQEFLDAGNWKQALSFIDKKLKKGDKSLKLAVNKICFLLTSREPDLWGQALVELTILLGQKQPVTDIRILNTIEELVSQWPEWGSDAQSLADSMWERAVTLNPKDEQLVDRWFRTKFVFGRYKPAQKAAMMYSKNFPESRRPYFWAILASHLASNSLGVSETERSMFSGLAYKLLAKAAALVPAEDIVPSLDVLSLGVPKPTNPKPSTDSSRALKTPSDLLLLTEIYKSQGREKEALAVLNDPRTGLASSIGQSSWELIREKILLNESCELWDTQWNECYDLLCKANSSQDKKADSIHDQENNTFLNDWAVWKALVTACLQIREKEIFLKTKSIINSFLESEQSVMRHNARRALIDYYAANPLPIDHDPDDLLSALLAYYYDYSTSPICFEGLRLAHLLTRPQKVKFLDQVRRYADTKYGLENNAGVQFRFVVRADWVAAEINSLKQDYAITVSVDESGKARKSGEPGDLSLLEVFVANALRLYHAARFLNYGIPITERRPGDDAAILAASACIRLFAYGDSRAIIRCAAILELLLEDSPRNYDAQLMAIRVYIYLGLVPHALKHYAKLDIKHIQFLTNSWILLTRISTIHPHPCPTTPGEAAPGVTSPAQLLKAVIQWGGRNETQIETGISEFLKFDSFSGLLQHLDYQKQTEFTPLVRYSMVCELQRIIRLGHAPWEDPPFLDDVPDLDGSDVRSRSSFPNYEGWGKATFEEHLRTGPTPQGSWLKSQLRYIELTQSIGGINVPGRSTVHPSLVDGPDMTPPECSASAWTNHMLNLHTASLTNDETWKKHFVKVTKATLAGLANSMKVWTGRAEVLSQDPGHGALGLINGLDVPHWQYFHFIFTALDHCSLTTLWLLNQSVQNQVTGVFPDQTLFNEKVAEMEAITAGLFDNLHTAARKLHADLAQPHHVAELVELISGKVEDEEDKVGKKMRDLVPHERWITEYSKTLLQEWQEGLVGVMMTKLRSPL
ncbi:hypothetical protein MMC13_000471 [Lambiella insularis]|nr:hypothetical protein [Lambiella insularis]